MTLKLPIQNADMKVKMLNTVHYSGVVYPMGAVLDVDEKIAYAMGSSCQLLAPPEVAVVPQVEVKPITKPKKKSYKGKNKMLTGEEIKNK